MENVATTINLLIFLNFEKICELPTNKVFILDLVDEMNETLGAERDRFRRYDENIVISALKMIVRLRLYGGREDGVADFLSLGRFSNDKADNFKSTLQHISRRLRESILTTVTMVPVHELDRALCPELIGAELER